jgi:lycopene cyclase domain-containing protein
MGSEFMNLIQLISGGQKFAFPATYVQLQAVFMLIPMLLLIFLPRRLLHSSPHLHKYAWIFGSIMFVASLIQGASWDNLGAKYGIWIFDKANMIGHIGFIPVEEYVCIVNDMLLTTLFALQVWTFRTDHLELCKEVKIPGAWLKYLLIVIFLVFGILGWNLLIKGEEKYLFFGIILGFFFPFFALEWAVGYDSFMRRKLLWLASWLIPGLYMYLFDSLAVNQGIWIFDYKFTTNTWIFGTINLEVFLVYISISKAVAQPIWWAMDFFDRKKNEGKTT